MPDRSQLWIPGAPGPHEDFVARIQRQAAALGTNVSVTVELLSGATFELISLSPDPGYGFVTLRPHPEGEAPSEVIVPVGSIAQVRLHAPEERRQFGFDVPTAPASA
jgi:hypothetical protein